MPPMMRPAWTRPRLAGFISPESMAARSLPVNQQGKAIFYGSAAAIVMRILLTIGAVEMLQVPYLKIVGGLALLGIGAQLLLDTEEEGQVKEPGTMAAAIRTILIADLVNVFNAGIVP